MSIQQKLLKEISKYSTDQLIIMLKQNGLDDCCQAIQKRQIDGEEFLNLTELQIKLWGKDITKVQQTRLYSTILMLKERPSQFCVSLAKNVNEDVPKNYPTRPEKPKSMEKAIKAPNLGTNTAPEIKTCTKNDSALYKLGPPKKVNPQLISQIGSLLSGNNMINDNDQGNTLSENNLPTPPKLTNFSLKDNPANKSPFLNNRKLSDVQLENVAESNLRRSSVEQPDKKNISISREEVRNNPVNVPISKRPLPPVPTQPQTTLPTKPVTRHVSVSQASRPDQLQKHLSTKPVSRCESFSNVSTANKNTTPQLPHRPNLLPKPIKPVSRNESFSKTPTVNNNVKEQENTRALPKPPVPALNLSFLANQPSLPSPISPEPHFEDDDTYSETTLADYTKEPWYKDVNRKVAKELLQNRPNGSFIIRPSSQQQYLCTLMVYYNTRLYNLPIIQDDSGYLYIGSIGTDKKTFSSVNEIIEYYSQNELSLNYNEKEVFVRLYHYQ